MKKYISALKSLLVDHWDIIAIIIIYILGFWILGIAEMLENDHATYYHD